MAAALLAWKGYSHGGHDRDARYRDAEIEGSVLRNGSGSIFAAPEEREDCSALLRAGRRRYT